MSIVISIVSYVVLFYSAWSTTEEKNLNLPLWQKIKLEYLAVYGRAYSEQRASGPSALNTMVKLYHESLYEPI